MNELRQLPREQQKRLLIKYLTIVFGGVGLFSLLSSVVILAVFVSGYDPANNRATTFTPAGVGVSGQGGGLNFGDALTPVATATPSIITTFVVYGIDNEGGGADATMIGSFNRQTGMIEIINIPRDTLIAQRPNTMAALESMNRRFPVIPKITDLFRVGNAVGQGEILVNTYIEEWLGIQIDYYAVVDLDAFRYIVDLVGPIEMYIPHRLWYDPGFGEPIFDVPAGWNMLTGQTAEWVVRYRASYAMADIQRIAVQQEFMRVFFEHVMTLDVLANIDNVRGMLEIVSQHVTTNFGLLSLVNHAPHIPSLSGLNMQTMPGDPSAWLPITLPTGVSNVSFVAVFQDEMNELVNRIFHGIEPVGEIAADEETQ